MKNDGRSYDRAVRQLGLAAMFRTVALYQNQWIAPGQALADLGLLNRVP